jgi:hypothetical protein
MSYIAVNAVAAVVSAAVAVLVPRELRHLYPIGLVWFPVAGFSSAVLSCVKRLAPWMAFVALGLNIASLALFFLAGYASVADVSVGVSGLAYALAGAAVAGWNLVHLARRLSAD